MDVRIGIIQTPKELDVELGDGEGREKVLADIEEALGQPEGVLWLTDKRGRRVAVPVAKVATSRWAPSTMTDASASALRSDEHRELAARAASGPIGSSR